MLSNLKQSLFFEVSFCKLLAYCFAEGTSRPTADGAEGGVVFPSQSFFLPFLSWQSPKTTDSVRISSRIAGQVDLFSSDSQACAQTRAGERAALSVQSAAAAAMQHLQQRSASELFT